MHEAECKPTNILLYFSRECSKCKGINTQPNWFNQFNSTYTELFLFTD